MANKRSASEAVVDKVTEAAFSVSDCCRAAVSCDAPASMPPPAKKANIGDGSDIIPRPVQQKKERSPYVFYPDIYDTFDAAKIGFAKDPQKSREGNGDMLFMCYLFPDSMQPLMIQTPNAMFSPTGINMGGAGKPSMLLSAGQDWENNPLMVKFKGIMDAIQQRVIDVAVEKSWNDPFPSTAEQIRANFSDIMFVGISKKTKLPFNPSVKAVILSGKDATELYGKDIVGPDGSTAAECLLPGDVDKCCSVTGILHFPWAYKKNGKKANEFSVRSNMFQARIFPSSGGFMSMSHDGCAIAD